MRTTLAILVLATAPIFSQVPGFRGLNLGMPRTDVVKLASGHWIQVDLSVRGQDTGDASPDSGTLMLLNDGRFGCGTIGRRKYCPTPGYVTAEFYKGTLYSIRIVSEGFADSTGGDSLRVYCQSAAEEFSKIYGRPMQHGELDRLANPAVARRLRADQRVILAEWRLPNGSAKGNNRQVAGGGARIRIELQRIDEDLPDEQGEPGHRMSSLVVITIVDPSVERARKEGGVRDF